MRRNLIYAGPRQWFIAVLILAIGLSAYGCKDSVSISEEVQVPLSSLTVTPGALQPAFFSNTTNYLVEVSTTVTSITVTASPKASTTTMTINGVDTKPGQGRPVPLSPSETTTDITIVLTNQNGIESTYAIVVRKVANTLSALTVTPPGTFPPPGFTPNTLDYQVDVGSGVASVTVVATKADPHAVMSGSVTAKAGVATGKATIPLNGPGTDTLVSITVAVPNNEAKTYTITVHRALSGDNNLSALTVTPGPLVPAFAVATLNYTVDVATNVTEVIVTATKADPNAVISGDLPNEGQATIQLDGPGTSRVISIIVTAQDTVTTKTYRITVNRAASANNNLSTLTVTPGALVPAFAAATLDYTVDVATDVTEVTVTATKADSSAVLSGSIADPGKGQATGQATIQLGGPGTSTPLSITVTAPSGDFKTYAITVNRAAPSSDNNLSALTVTGGPLVPDFASNTMIYTLDVPSSVDSVTVSATKSDLNAVMSGDVTAGTGIPTGQETFPLVPLFPRTVLITVTAPNGDSKTYTITITRALL